MTTLPHLSQRSIIAYNRFARDVAALNYLVRAAKPSGTLSEQGRATVASILRTANRLSRRETGIPFFACIDPHEPLTIADLVLVAARLTMACIAFEEKYAHLSEEGMDQARAYQARLVRGRKE